MTTTSDVASDVHWSYESLVGPGLCSPAVIRTAPGPGRRGGATCLCRHRDAGILVRHICCVIHCRGVTATTSLQRRHHTSWSDCDVASQTCVPLALPRSPLRFPHMPVPLTIFLIPSFAFPDAARAAARHSGLCRQATLSVHRYLSCVVSGVRMLPRATASPGSSRAEVVGCGPPAAAAAAAAVGPVSCSSTDTGGAETHWRRHPGRAPGLPGATAGERRGVHEVP